MAAFARKQRSYAFQLSQYFFSPERQNHSSFDHLKEEVNLSVFGVIKIQQTFRNVQ